MRKSQLPSAVLQTISEAAAWCSYKPLRSKELDPSSILDVPNWSHGSEPIEAWIERTVDSHRRAISWINETRSGILTRSKLAADSHNELPEGRLLVYEHMETVDDGASEAASMGFYDERDAPPWDTWVMYADHAVFCWVPDSIMQRAQDGIDANPVDCIHWADASHLARIKV